MAGIAEQGSALTALLRGIEKQAADMAHVQQAETVLEELGGSIEEAVKRLEAAKEDQE